MVLEAAANKTGKITPRENKVRRRNIQVSLSKGSKTFKFEERTPGLRRFFIG